MICPHCLREVSPPYNWHGPGDCAEAAEAEQAALWGFLADLREATDGMVGS